MLVRPWLLLGTALVSGCGVGLSSFQPAHVPAQGHLHAELGVDISYPTQTVSQVIEAAESVEEAADQRTLTDAEKTTIFEGGAALALNPLAILPHLGVDYAPWERWEIGARLSTAGWRLALRRQLLVQADHGVDLSLGLGVGRAIFTPPIEEVLSKLEVDDFERWNLDVPVAIGRHGEWYRVWGGPRFMWSTVSQSMTLTLPDFGGGPPEANRVSGTVSGRGVYVGGYAGVALGYKSLFVGPELTLVQLIGDADVSALGGTQNVAVKSFVVYPAFAVMGEF